MRSTLAKPGAAPGTGAARGSRPRFLGTRTGSAGLAVRGVGAAARAELLELDPVGVVPPVLLRDVVPLLAHRAGQGDLGSDVTGLARHDVPLLLRLDVARSCGAWSCGACFA